MSSFSLEMALRRAHALCGEAGIDPDQLDENGRPEWFRFFDQGRASLQNELESQDSLARLKAFYDHDYPHEVAGAQPGNDERSCDPLTRLRELYEEEMGKEQVPAIRRDVLLSQSRSDATEFAATPMEPRTGNKPSDPLQALRILEVAVTRNLPGHDNSQDLAARVDGIPPPANSLGLDDIFEDLDAGVYLGKDPHNLLRKA